MYTHIFFSRIPRDFILVNALSFSLEAREKKEEKKTKEYSVKARIDFQRPWTLFLLPYHSEKNESYRKVHESVGYTRCIKSRAARGYNFLDWLQVDFFLGKYLL